jgi:rubredoxin
MLCMCLRALVFSLTRMATIASFIVVTRPDIVTESRTWMCLICGWIYDEAVGDSDHGIAPGTAWADIPLNWSCPECGARKEDFEMVQV